jgi:hypothetical protein
MPVNWLEGFEPWVIWVNQHMLALRDSAVECTSENCVVSRLGGLKSGLAHSIAPQKGPARRTVQIMLIQTPAQQSCRSVERHVHSDGRMDCGGT